MEASEFGKALRRQREQVRPESVGLPVGSRRRAAGLRREEVAGLAGISVDYLTRLEQGRATSPSPQIVEALARALRLADTERELLFTLAGLVAPGPGLICTRITASVQRLLDRLGNVPLVVYDAAWNLIVANAPYDALMGATSALKGNDRNGVWRNLVGPGSRAVQSAEEQGAAAARLVADLRLTAARYPKDPGLRRLLAELRSASPLFVELWTAASEPLPPDPSRHKVIRHPAVGDIALTCDTLVVASDDLRIMVYTAEPGSPDAELLELAIVLGTQELTAPVAGRLRAGG
ncbi:helix-turn-helix protein [Propionicimonas paludicola]|uniref:Helix-turn-helix protein n=1 Tax=Propionicimonas paludicola TaxID=185243 RepID=A0A2A9CTZ3_9ACTN|nr:helix-turn-helix transcriptional regulator [Propionicimonas paludicola]PFG17927.1 helix-turn-helix protein [Propionicimonas paludicola]